MTNDAARHELAEILALVEEQMADLADLQKKRAGLTATVALADGAVEVTVNERGIVIATVIGESYLSDFDFAGLGAHVTAAAQSAAYEVARRSAELLAPLTERRGRFLSLSDQGVDVPDLNDLIPDLDGLIPGLGRLTDAEPKPTDTKPPDSKDDSEEPDSYPTVRR